MDLYTVDLRRSRGGTVFVCSSVCCPRFIQFALASCYSAHKRIVDIMKVYIEMKNMQVELIPFRKNIDFIDVGNLEVGNLRVYEIELIAIRDVSPPFSAAME